MWLKVPVEERDEKGSKRLTGGKGNDRGTPQGGVISPALANLYMNRMLKGWKQTRRGEQFEAHIVNYADDFVILSRRMAKESLEWTRGVVERLGLTLNEKKTSVRNAGQERFDFLGYTFGPHYSLRTGREYIGYSPSKKSVNRVKAKVGDLAGTRQCGNVGGGMQAAQPDSGGMADILQPREHGDGIPGDRSACL